MNKFNPEKTQSLKKINNLMKIFFHKKKINSEIEWESVKRILIVDMTLIGDTVMLVPFLKVLKKNAINAQIDLVCGKWGKVLLDEQELVDNYYYMTGDKLETPKKMIKNFKYIYKTIKNIRREKYDVVIEPRGDIRYIFFMHWCKGKRKISYNYTGGECLLTDVVLPNEKIEHLIDDKMYLLSNIGCKVEKDDRIPKLKLSNSFVEYREEFISKNDLEGKYILGIHPGASIDIKQWDKYSELVKKIAEQDKNSVFLIVFSGPGEEKIANNVYESAVESGIEARLSKTGLDEYIKLLSLCDCVICNDSGAGHISAAFGVDVICVMGPFNPEFCAPVGNYVYTVSKMFKCKPCMSKACKDGTGICLKSVTVEEVYQLWKKSRMRNKI